MINNTSSSDLRIVDLPFVQLHKKIELTNSYGNNNNNDMSTNNNMSSFERMKSFTYYTSGVSGVDAQDVTPTVIQQLSSAETIKNSNLLVNSKLTANLNGSSHCVMHDPCGLYNSKQEELTTKIIDKFRDDNVRSKFKSGVDVNFTSTKTKTTSDSSSSCSNSNSNSSNSSSKSDRQKSPMCRTEDQENAFRQIKVVHNYSKSNRYDYSNGEDSHVANMYSSNSSNQDEDEDEEEDDDDELEDVDYERHLNEKVRTLIAIGRQKANVKHAIELQHSASSTNEKIPTIKMEEEENKSLPDHHARRPMNAFLIFCKRHRGIVKDKYKNFENRSITKILGEWWASLDQNDKTPYVNLAKQNKDAFFSANPNFKWYKLPAPSLRTLNTRPGNMDRPNSISSDYQYELNDSQIQDKCSSSQRNRLEPKREYFKLADETQMGELNNLMRPAATPSNNDALQDALGETSDYFKTVCKRTENTTGVEVKAKRLKNDNGFSSSEEDVLPKKSPRSCKGKKYQELMNSGQITPVTPKKQMSSKLSGINNDIEENQQFSEYSECKPSNGAERPQSKQSLQLKEVKEEYDYSEYCGSPVKQQFRYVSFDLDDKIKALPAQCLETYLQRKKNTKRKKKINSKKRSTLPKSPLPSKSVVKSKLQNIKTAQEAREQMVGSQKRKARKESITRRDINSIQNEVQLILCSGSNDTSIVVNGVSLSETLPVINQSGGTSDLHILAEVAANHTGIAKM